MPHAVVTDGLSLFYEEAGAGDPVVFVHAYLGRTDVWAGQRIALISRFRVIAYDARGHGRTEAPDEAERYGRSFAVRDLVGLLDALEIDSAHLVGLSMGADTVLHTLLGHPDRVRSAVLADIGSGADDPDERLRWADDVAESFLTRGSEATYDEILSKTDLLAGLGTVRKKAAEGMRKLVAAQSAVAMAHTVRTFSAPPTVYDMGDAAARVACPVLLIRGENDAPVVGPSRFLADRIPGAREIVIPGVSHVSNIQAPAAFNRALLDFLAA